MDILPFLKLCCCAAYVFFNVVYILGHVMIFIQPTSKGQHFGKLIVIPPKVQGLQVEQGSCGY